MVIVAVPSANPSRTRWTPGPLCLISCDKGSANGTKASGLRHERAPRSIAVGVGGYEGKSLQWPSETTSTVPSVTLMAVSSSMAYAGPPRPATHLSASSMVFSGMSS